MVRYADKFMALNNRNKAAITVGMLVGAAVVVYLLMKLVAMLRKETSFKGPPSKMPVMTRRMPVMNRRMPVMNRRRPGMEPSMARTTRRRRMTPIAHPLQGDKINNPKYRRKPN